MRSSHAASGKSTMHCAAMSMLVISLLMWRCPISRRLTPPHPRRSAISVSVRTTVKQSSRAGSRRSASPSSSKVPMSLMPISSNDSLDAALRARDGRGVPRGDGSIAPDVVRVISHALQVGDDAIEDDDGRLVENRIGDGDVVAESLLELGEEPVVKRAETFGCGLQLGHVVEKRDVRVDGPFRKLLRLSKLKRSFA